MPSNDIWNIAWFGGELFTFHFANRRCRAHFTDKPQSLQGEAWVFRGKEAYEVNGGVSPPSRNKSIDQAWVGERAEGASKDNPVRIQPIRNLFCPLTGRAQRTRHPTRIAKSGVADQLSILRRASHHNGLDERCFTEPANAPLEKGKPIESTQRSIDPSRILLIARNS